MEIYCNQLKKGVFLSAYKTDRFKSSLMTVSFALPLDFKTASGYSLLTNLMSVSTGKYPTMQSFSVIKDELYALGLDSYVQPKGELLLVRFEINCIADSFAFDNERVLYRAIELLADAIFNPNIKNGAFPQKSIETEKLCLLEEIASIIENKPAYAMLRAKEIMCEGEPFAVDAAGDAELVSALTNEDLIACYNECLNNAPVFITYAGEADGGYIKECIEKLMPFANREAFLPKPTVHIPKNETAEVKEVMDMEQSILVLGFTTEIPDSAKKRAILSVFDEIFGGSPASRLFMNVREKEGLCYFCSSYPSGRKNVLFVSCGLEPKREEAAKDAVLRELSAMQEGLFGENDLLNAKNSIIRSLRSVDGSLGSITGYMLGQSLFEDSVGLEETVLLIQSVTKQEIIDFAKTLSHELTYILSSEGGE